MVCTFYATAVYCLEDVPALIHHPNFLGEAIGVSCFADEPVLNATVEKTPCLCFFEDSGLVAQRLVGPR